MFKPYFNKHGNDQVVVKAERCNYQYQFGKHDIGINGTAAMMRSKINISKKGLRCFRSSLAGVRTLHLSKTMPVFHPQKLEKIWSKKKAAFMQAFYAFKIAKYWSNINQKILFLVYDDNDVK